MDEFRPGCIISSCLIGHAPGDVRSWSCWASCTGQICALLSLFGGSSSMDPPVQGLYSRPPLWPGRLSYIFGVVGLEEMTPSGCAFLVGQAGR